MRSSLEEISRDPYRRSTRRSFSLAPLCQSTRSVVTRVSINDDSVT
jgi:hypothetical protein